MDMDSTIRGTSNFRHFSNSLKKRGYDYAAGYVAAVGTVTTTNLAVDVYRSTKDVLALTQILRFFDGVCDSTPAAIVRGLQILRSAVSAAEKIERVHQLVLDPFALIEADSVVVVKLTKAELKAVTKAIGETTPYTDVNSRAFRKLRDIA